MPHGLISRFIVAMHALIEAGSTEHPLVWQTGVILLDQLDTGARAEIVEGFNRDEINIKVVGPRRRDLMVKITHEFNKIHRDFPGLKFETLVPCNCSECVVSDAPETYPIERLRRRISKRQYTLPCEASYETVDARRLIDTIMDNRLDDPYRPSLEPNHRPVNNINISVPIDQAMTDTTKYTNNLQGANVANFANEVKDNARQQANQHNHPAQQQSLADAAKEIQTLLDQLSQTYPTDTRKAKNTFADVVVERVEQDPSLTQRLLSATKEGSIAALDGMLNHPAASFVIAALEDWQATKRPDCSFLNGRYPTQH